MLIMGNMKPSRRGWKNISTKTYPEIARGLEDQAARLKRIIYREGHRIDQGHILDALMAYLLTRSEAEQDRILREGKRIIELLDDLKVDVGPHCLPGSYGASGAAQGGNPLAGLTIEPIRNLPTAQIAKRIGEATDRGGGGFDRKDQPMPRRRGRPPKAK